MSAAPVPPDGETNTAGIEAAKQAIYETMPVVLKDLVARSEAEAAIGVPHGAGVPDRWLADVAVRAYLAAGRAAATPDPPTSWECCGHTFTGTADFISGARSAHVCDIAPEDVPDAETAYAMGKAAATPPAEGSVSYRVRDRDSDYKAMCHEDRDHAELLLKAWLADGRDAVVERRHVFDGGWLPVGRPFFTGQQERMLDRCEAFDAANPDPETDT